MVQAAKKLFPTGRFLWQANKSIEDDPFGSPAQRLPNKPHGLNSFMDFDDIVFLSSLNPPADHFRFLKQQYGLDGDEVRGFTYLASAYQATMRTSIRDPKNELPKRILVPDLSLAEYLQEILSGSKLKNSILALSMKRQRNVAAAGNINQIAKESPSNVKEREKKSADS